MRTQTSWSVISAVIVLAGCGDPAAADVDGGSRDAGSPRDGQVAVDAAGDASASPVDAARTDGGPGEDTFPVGGWTVVVNFDEGTPGEQANGDDGLTEAFRDSRYTDAFSYAGGQAAIVSVEEGDTAFGRWGGRVEFPDLGEGDSIWFRCFVLLPDGFDFGTDSGFLKFMRIHTASASGGNEGYHDVLFRSDADGIVVGSEVEDDHYRNHPGWRENGSAVTSGEWHALEMHLSYSATPANAVYRVWQDGELIFEDVGMTRTLASSSSIVDFAYIFSYWNGGAPRNQSAYIDEIVITSGVPHARDAMGNPYIGLEIVSPR